MSITGSLLLLVSLTGVLLCARSRRCAGKSSGGFQRLGQDEPDDDDDDEYYDEYMRPTSLGRQNVLRLIKLNDANGRKHVEYAPLTSYTHNDIDQQHSEFSHVELSD